MNCQCGHEYYDHRQDPCVIMPRGKCANCCCDIFDKATPGVWDAVEYYGLPIDLLTILLGEA